jgi:hypothetical protein
MPSRTVTKLLRPMVVLPATVEPFESNDVTRVGQFPTATCQSFTLSTSPTPRLTPCPTAAATVATTAAPSAAPTAAPTAPTAAPTVSSTAVPTAAPAATLRVHHLRCQRRHQHQRQLYRQPQHRQPRPLQPLRVHRLRCQRRHQQQRQLSSSHCVKQLHGRRGPQESQRRFFLQLRPQQRILALANRRADPLGRGCVALSNLDQSCDSMGTSDRHLSYLNQRCSYRRKGKYW